MRRHPAILLLLLIACVAICSTISAADTPPHSQWMAYEGRANGAVSPLLSVLYTAPEVAVFQDGRIVWLEVNSWRNGDGQNPCAWRTAHLTYREKSDFRALLEDSEFFTINLPPETVGEELPGAGYTFVGGHMLHKTRDVLLHARYVPESEGSRRYVARMNEMVGALKVMTQRVSDCYRPSAIRVAAFKGLVSASAPTVEWPVPTIPGLKGGRLVVYRGAEAHKIIDALAISTMVTIEGENYSAAWAPLLDVPSPVPATLMPTRNPEPAPALPPGTLSPVPETTSTPGK